MTRDIIAITIVAIAFPLFLVFKPLAANMNSKIYKNIPKACPKKENISPAIDIQNAISHVFSSLVVI